MSGILRLESLTKGNTLKQGDKTPLKYRLFDADGEKLNIAGKSAKVRLVYPDFLTIGYEKGGLIVAQDDTVTFTIDSVIPSRIYHVEIIVDDKFIFPSRADQSKFTVDKSSLGTEANIIEIVGKDVLINAVKSKVDAELQPLVTSLESAEQAELQRATAETVRVSAEAQREIDHANRSAELAGKADKIVLKNLIENGDFSSDIIPEIFNGGWYPANKEIVEEHGRRSLKLMKHASGSTRAFIGRNDLKPNHTYLLEGLTYSLSTDGGNIWLSKASNGDSTGEFVVRKAGEWVKFNFITKANSKGIIMIGGNILEGNPLYFDDVQIIDLTETFGAGNEPTKEEMNELIKVTGYIDGEYALNNKEALIWTLALIRRNKNAIVALGGA